MLLLQLWACDEQGKEERNTSPICSDSEPRGRTVAARSARVCSTLCRFDGAQYCICAQWDEVTVTQILLIAMHGLASLKTERAQLKFSTPVSCFTWTPPPPLSQWQQQHSAVSNFVYRNICCTKCGDSSCDFRSFVFLYCKKWSFYLSLHQSWVLLYY